MREAAIVKHDVLHHVYTGCALTSIADLTSPLFSNRFCVCALATASWRMRSFAALLNHSYLQLCGRAWHEDRPQLHEAHTARAHVLR